MIILYVLGGQEFVCSGREQGDLWLYWKWSNGMDVWIMVKNWVHGGYNRSVGVSKKYKWDVFWMSMLG